MGRPPFFIRFALLFAVAPAILGQPAPSLGTAEGFVILAGTRVTSSGPTRVTGKIGVSSGAVVSGFPPGILAFGAEAIETNERTVRRAQQDNAAAFDALGANAPIGAVHLAGEIAVGDGILRIAGNLIVDPGAKMILKDGALSSHIFWVVDGSVTLGAGSAVAGNFLARNDITFGRGVTLAGRALSQNGAVTLDADAVNLCGKLVTLSPPPLPSGIVGAKYQDTMITPGGGDAPYELTLVDGALPPGLAFNGGLLSGTPAAPGHFVFAVMAIDDKGAVGIRYYTIDVCPNLTLPPSLPPANVCDPYKAPFGSDAYTYEFSGLPPGLQWTPPFITGTPRKKGDFPVEACVTDPASGCRLCAQYTLSVGCNMTIAASLPNGAECQPYKGTVAPSCDGSYVVSLISDGLPPGLAGPTPGGLISGTPTSPGKTTFTVRIDHESGCSVIGTYTIEIAPAAPLPPIALFGTVCSPVNYNLGGTITGSLPKGLHGALQGVPRETGTFPFTVTSSDPNACPRQRSYTITITCPKTILLPTLPNEWRFYTPLSIAIVNPDLASCFTYSVNANTLPPNTFFDTETRTLKGLPDALGIFNIAVTAKDSESGCEVTQIYPLEIFDPPLFCEPLIVASPLFGTLSSGTAGVAYPAQVFTAAGGIPPYTYDVVIATLPPGLSLSPFGVLTGTPTTPGRFIFAVNATDSTGTPGCPQVYSIDIGN
jgi:hypothetical protein